MKIFLTILVMLFLCEYSFASDEKNNYFQVGGNFGHYDLSKFKGSNDLNGFGVDMGFGHKFGFVALEVNQKISYPQYKDYEVSYHSLGMGTRFFSKYISAKGGLSWNKIRGIDSFFQYYAGLGAQLDLSFMGVYTDLTYHFSDVKIYDFTAGARVNF